MKKRIKNDRSIPIQKESGVTLEKIISSKETAEERKENEAKKEPNLLRKVNRFLENN